MKSLFFWDVTPWRLVYGHHHFSVLDDSIFRGLFLTTLKTEEASSYETLESVFYFTLPHVSDGGSILINLVTYLVIYVVN
jgi:hypothetical protein